MTANTPHTRKAKGRTFQQKIVSDLQKIFEMTQDDIRSTSMGAPGIDVLLSSKAKEAFPFGIECKHQKRLQIRSWIHQTETNAKPENVFPLLVFRVNNTLTTGRTYVIFWREVWDKRYCLLDTAEDAYIRYEGSRGVVTSFEKIRIPFEASEGAFPVMMMAPSTRLKLKLDRKKYVMMFWSDFEELEMELYDIKKTVEKENAF